MTKLHQILSPSFTTILSQLRQESFTLYHPEPQLVVQHAVLPGSGQLWLSHLRADAPCRLPLSFWKKGKEAHRTAQNSTAAAPDMLYLCTRKAREPEGDHLRPVPTSSTARSTVIFDPFCSHLRGVK